MSDFSYWPYSIVTNVRGEEQGNNGRGRTSWRVDSDGILHVSHRSEDGDTESLTFRLVEVEQKWVEVDES